MENSGVLAQRIWPKIRKVSVAAAVIGASATLLIFTLDRLNVAPPAGSALGKDLLWLFLLMQYLPTAAGLAREAPPWQWIAFSTILNALFCSLVGILVGSLSVAFQRKAKSSQ